MKIFCEHVGYLHFMLYAGYKSINCKIAHSFGFLLKENFFVSTNFSSRVIVFYVTKLLIPKGVMTCQHFRPQLRFTQEYIRECLKGM